VLAGGPDLTPLARARIGDLPTRHLAFVTEGLIAADGRGRAIIIDVATE